MELYANLGALAALINELLISVPTAGSFCDSLLVFRHFGIMISSMRRNRLCVVYPRFLRKRRFFYLVYLRYIQSCAGRRQSRRLAFFELR